MIKGIPERGDLVIRPATQEGRSVFVVQTAPGPDRWVLDSREAAISQAVAFAKRTRVSVWLLDGGPSPLVQDFRTMHAVVGQ